MNWLTLVSTVVGAVIGIASTLLADRARFRRDLVKADQDARRALYADFLIADATAHDTMRVEALRAHDPDALRVAVHEAFQSSDLYAVRYRMTVLAPPEVVRGSEETFLRLRKVRKVLAGGSGFGSDAYRTLHREHQQALGDLRNSMRADLGKLPLPAAGADDVDDDGQPAS